MFTTKQNLVALALAAALPSFMAVALADKAPDFPPSTDAPDGETPASTGDRDILPTEVIRFEFDSTAIDSADVLQLDAAARWLKAHPDRRLVVEAHTDATGARLYNVDLADRRASTVRNILRAHGAADDLVVKVICGEGRSLGASKAADRRVVLYATDLDFNGIVRETPEPCYPVIL